MIVTPFESLLANYQRRHDHIDAEREAAWRAYQERLAAHERRQHEGATA